MFGGYFETFCKNLPEDCLAPIEYIMSKILCILLFLKGHLNSNNAI